MEFENSGIGKCVLLKESEDYSLIYCLKSKNFIVAYGLDKNKGSWSNGHYFDKNLDKALAFYNENIKSIQEELEI